MRGLEPLLTALMISGSNAPAGTSLRCYSPVPTTSKPKTFPFKSIWRRYRRDGYCNNSGFFIAGNPRQPMLQSYRLSKVATLPPSQPYDSVDFDGLTRTELQALCKRRQLRAVGKTCELVSRLRDYEEQLKHQQQYHELEQPSEQAPTSSHLVKDVSFPSPQEKSAGTAGGEDNGLGASSALDVPGISVVPVQLQQLLPSSTFGADRYRDIFPELSGERWAKVKRLGELLVEWNGRVNLISRKDINNVMPHHIIPCLTVAKAVNFPHGDLNVLDVGTGGGLPGLPMAIYYPEVQFTLIDGTAKKIQAVQDMVERLGLMNVRTFHARAEDVYEPFDFVMGRAVTSLPKFVRFIDKNLKQNNVDRTTLDGNANTVAHVGEESTPLKRGVLYMRGEIGREELEELGAQPSTVFSLQRVLIVNAKDESGETTAETVTAKGTSDRGYSSVFHFTSEAIWNRAPRIANGHDHSENRANRQ